MEWIVPNELYWLETDDWGRKCGILYKVNPLGGRNITMAYVKRVLIYMDCAKEKYEALLVRLSKHTVDDWSLGVFDTVQEGKEAIITTLVLQRMEGT